MEYSGTILVVSAPSGGGKGTIIATVMNDDKQIVHTVSATTRKPRKTEENGKHYWFMTVDEFNRKIEENAFIEWADVHGNYYGTMRTEVESHLRAGHDVVLELDIQGMRSVKATGSEVTTVFILPPSLEVLEQRIRDRGGLEEHEIKTRLLNAEIEMKASNEYDHIIVNDELDHAVTQFKNILADLRQQ